MAIQHSFVALLDVLGYKNKIRADRQNANEDFKERLERSLSVLSGINETEAGYQAISDTIIVSAHSSTPFSDYLGHLVAVQRSFLKNGLFIRGGVAFAPHFKSGTLTYSHALPIAYELEQKQAVYPRIVIDKNIIEMMGRGEKLECEAKEISDKKFICIENGVYFLNILNDSPSECYEYARSIYCADKDFLDGNEHEMAKHRWLQNFILTMSPQGLSPYIEEVRVFSPFDYFGL